LGILFYFILFYKSVNLLAMQGDKEIILVGDRVLIDPDSDQTKTPSGLYLPPGVKEKEPFSDDAGDEPWAPEHKEPQYLPLQAVEGDYAIFLRKYAIEIELESKRYLIVPHSYILVLIREDYLEE
jgi:co-chaperonin GroES (HSP10)